jgi:hypothetical protein
VRSQKAAESGGSGDPGAAHWIAPIHRPDEHWLQAVIRRNPGLVGVEQPALRELPAWRPGGDGSAQSRGRGYIDLLGVDGHGDIRVVETKLASNTDDLLVCQGLDYYIWALAYRRILIGRLGAPDRAAFEIHYVIGDTADGKIHRSGYLPPQARNLDSAVRWRFQAVQLVRASGSARVSQLEAFPCRRMAVSEGHEVLQSAAPFGG